MATQQEFKVGDIVKLKSGGPDMTVQNAPEDTQYPLTCQWFAGKKLEHGRFTRESVELVRKG